MSKSSGNVQDGDACQFPEGGGDLQKEGWKTQLISFS